MTYQLLYKEVSTVARFFWDFAATSRKTCRYFLFFYRYFSATTTCTSVL